MKRRLRVGVVGVGYLGTFHAQKYKSLEEGGPWASEIQLVGVCDTRKEQVQQVVQSLGRKDLAAWTNPKDMLGQVDAVTLSTITPTHFELAQLFLENGIHVLVEKPICTHSKEAHHLVNLANKKKLILAVGQSERFNPAFQEMRRRWETKSPPQAIILNRHAPYKPRGAEVSVIHDLMIHDMDLLTVLDSSPPSKISARAGKIQSSTYDWAVATLELESGLLGIIHSSRVASSMTRSIHLSGDHWILEANLQTGDLTEVETPSSSPVNYAMGRGDNLMAETEAFLGGILHQSPVGCTGEEGLRSLEMIEKVLHALE